MHSDPVHPDPALYFYICYTNVLYTNVLAIHRGLTEAALGPVHPEPPVHPVHSEPVRAAGRPGSILASLHRYIASLHF